jgi:predicted transcriptional regulator
MPLPERVLVSLSTPMRERLSKEAEKLNQSMAAVARAHIARSIAREDERERVTA